MPPYYPITTGGTVFNQQLIWYQWNEAMTPQTTVQIDPWYGWVNTSGTSGYVQPMTTNPVQTNVWIQWNTTNTYGTTLNVGPNPYYAAAPPAPAPVELSPEQRRRLEHDRARRDLIHRNRTRARSIKRKFADRRAEELLLEHLTDGQREQWSKDKSFTVITADGAREYRIARGTAGNVTLVKMDGEAPVSKHGRPLRVGSRFCMHVYHPDGHVPDDDNVLAQKMLLECGGESEFLQLANVS